MRILAFTNIPISSSSIAKGTGTWLSMLMNSLSTQTDLHICFYGDTESDFNHDRYCIHILKKSIFRRLGNFMPLNFALTNGIPKYLSVIDKVRPDIIHIHGTENTFIELLRYQNELPPIVVSIQGNISVYKQMYFRGLSPISCFVSFNFKPLFYYLWFLKISKLEIVALRDLRYVFGRTNWDYRITRTFSPLSEYFNVGEMLREDFYNNEWVKPDITDKVVLFTTSADIIYKGFEVICHCLALLDKLDMNVEWKVAGISQEDSIVRTVKLSLGLKFPSSKLRLLGNLSSKELVHEMLTSHIYIGVSHIENSPNSICEAMLLGMPCISSGVGGVSSLIEDNVDGILVQDGDQWGLAGAIVDLVDNYDDKSIVLGRAARKRAIDRHNKDHILNDLIAAYTKIIH
jgi:glycosyltransferase involved in cell wall biosynthesis